LNYPQRSLQTVFRTPGSDTVLPLFEVFTLTPEMAANHTVTLTAPDKLSTYVVHAVVATTSSIVVQTANFTVAASTVSLTSTVPRILRVGDNATAGVIVSFTGTQSFAFPLTVDVYASAVATSGTGATLKPLGVSPTAAEWREAADGDANATSIKATARVTLESPTDSEEVRFALYAAEQIGVTEVRFEASVAGVGIVDAVAVEVTTVQQQEAVMQGGTLRLAGSGSVAQGLVLSPAIPSACQRSCRSVGCLQAPPALFALNCTNVCVCPPSISSTLMLFCELLN
jgi:hypothetical protein